MEKYGIEVGSEICFFEGKKGNPVAHTVLGKVILCKHKMPLGYARVTSVEEREKYYLVTAEHIVRDLYSGINYEEFIQVLPLQGYKIGFDRTFDHDMDEQGIMAEHQIFAYNLQNRVVIVAETFTWEKGGRVGFNSIKIYLPGISVFTGYRKRTRLFRSGGASITQLDAGSTSYNQDGILEYVNDLMEREGHGNTWPADEYPSMWTYADDDLEYNEDGEWTLGKTTLKRLNLAPRECLYIFAGCNWLKDLEEKEEENGKDTKEV